MGIFALPQRLPAQASSPSTPSCLERTAEKIRLNSKVSVFKLNGEKYTGLLDSVGLGNSYLLLKKLELGYPHITIFRQNEINKIQYFERRKINPSHMVMGFLLGAAAGFFVGYAIGSGKSGFEGLDSLVIGTGVGAGTGFLVGTIIPAASLSTQTIVCK